MLCLQETKCPDDCFRVKPFTRRGYEHIAVNGQKGYHGVAIVSRVPCEVVERAGSAARTIAGHLGAPSDRGRRPSLLIHNFYVPAGGDEPDPEINPKFAPQARLPR